MVLMSGDVFVDRVRDRIGKDHVVVDPDLMDSFRTDRTSTVQGDMPRLVTTPVTAAQVASVVKLANEFKVPVIPQGALSGLAGGADPISGSVVINVAKMNRILDIDPVNLLATVEPGVINKSLKDAVAKEGFFYPPDPGSYSFCSIGGNVATNAGGLCCVKYGVTADYVSQLEIVSPTGEMMVLGRKTKKSSAGYRLAQLFVGSEGTLGVVTKATMRLRHAPPPVAGTVVASFSTLDEMGCALREIASKLSPSLLEVMDKVTVQAINSWKNLGIDEEAEAVIVAQSDVKGTQGVEELRLIEAICAAAGSGEIYRTEDPEEADALLEARRLALTALERLGPAILDDVGVPVSRIGDMISEIAKISKMHEIKVGTFGHGGDGNLHPTLILPSRAPEVLKLAERCFADIVSAALSMGGTISGEHGIGLIKREFMRDQYGPLEIDWMRRIKGALDPNGLFNPNKIVFDYQYF